MIAKPSALGYDHVLETDWNLTLHQILHRPLGKKWFHSFKVFQKLILRFQCQFNDFLILKLLKRFLFFWLKCKCWIYPLFTVINWMNVVNQYLTSQQLNANRWLKPCTYIWVYILVMEVGWIPIQGKFTLQFYSQDSR